MKAVIITLVVSLMFSVIFAFLLYVLGFTMPAFILLAISFSLYTVTVFSIGVGLTAWYDKDRIQTGMNMVLQAMQFNDEWDAHKMEKISRIISRAKIEEPIEAEYKSLEDTARHL